MGILSENMILLPKKVPTGSSLRFDNDREAYLTRTPTAPGNRRIWTYSCWVKLGNSALSINLLEAADDGDNRTSISMTATNKLRLVHIVSNLTSILLETEALFRDHNSWYHIVVSVDTTPSTPLYKMYVNGDEITSFSTNTRNAVQNDELHINEPIGHFIGARFDHTTEEFDGYMDEINLIDGYPTGVTQNNWSTTNFSDFFSDNSGTYDQYTPKAYTGSFGTNGFYLPINSVTTNEHFAAQTYIGTGANTEIGGLGFQPDLVWIKGRDTTRLPNLSDSVRGTNSQLFSHLDSAADNTQTNVITGFDADGFSMGDDSDVNTIGENYVAWSWQAGGAPTADNIATGSSDATDDSVMIDGVSNTDPLVGNLKATKISANTTLGFSIIDYKGIGDNTAPQSDSIDHKLGVSPEMIIVKKYSQPDDWDVWHKDLTDDDQYIVLNSTVRQSLDGGPGSHFGDPRVINNETFTVGYGGTTNAVNQDYIAYCFASKTGMSQVGSYTGNGNDIGPIVNFDGGGFKPAYILIKGIDAATQNDNWSILDSARANGDPNSVRAFPGVIQVDGQNELSSPSGAIRFTDTGFQPSGTSHDINRDGTTYIYLAFADTSRGGDVGRDHQPGSGTKNNWTPVNAQPYDVVPDTPENTFCTINPVSETLGDISGNSNYVPPQYPRPSYSEGNLRVSGEFSTDDANSDWSASAYTSANVWCNMAIPETGKWYFEFKRGKYNSVGFIDYYNFTRGVNVPNTTQLRYLETYFDYASTSVANDGSLGGMPGANNTLASAFQISDDVTTGISGNLIVHDNPDIWAWGIDTSGEVTLWLNGIVVLSNAHIGQYISRNITVSDGSSGYRGFAHFNFGQDSTFSGSESNSTGFTDSNGIGDFVYQPPSGYLALCTANLPEPDVIPDEHFNTVLYEGTGTISVNAINTVGFQPDLVWLKNRFLTGGYNHYLYDSIRGTSQLIPNGTDVENYTGEFLSFDSQGFTLGAVNGLVNDVLSVAEGNVAWCWKAGGDAVTNTEGNNLYIASSVVTDNIKSKVSANIKAGFSIITYTGDGIDGSSIGHGLDSTPELIVIKNRGESTGTNWPVYHKDLGIGANSFTNNLDLMSDAGVDNGDIYTNVGPSTFGVRNVISSGLFNNTYVAYCWHSVEGYSKIGSYTGNADDHGPFVYTGFTPKYVMIKRTGLGNWDIFDSVRHPNNPVDQPLYADLPNVEQAENDHEVDFLSNGFKLRDLSNSINNSGTYIYMAFAETPLKHTNAR